MCFGETSPCLASYRVVSVLGALMVLPLSVIAQSDETHNGRPWFADVSHYAKWPALGAAGGFIALAAVRHGDARGVQRELDALCVTDPSRCIVASAGNDALYVDDEARSLQERHTALSGQARGYLLGGQIALVVGGGMFLLDLIYGEEKPKNIPFTPLEVFGNTEEIGLSIRF